MPNPSNLQIPMAKMDHLAPSTNQSTNLNDLYASMTQYMAPSLNNLLNTTNCSDLVLSMTDCLDGSSSQSCCYPMSEVVSDVAGVASIVNSVIGSGGNVLTLLALRHAGLKDNLIMEENTHLFLGNLEVADLLYCVVCLPMYAAMKFGRGWPFSFISCYVIAIIRHFIFYGGQVSMAFIALHRCIGVGFPHIARKWFNASFSLWSIAFIWVYSGLIILPTSLGQFGTFGYNRKMGECDIVPVEGGYHNPHAVTDILGKFIPCGLIISSYILLWIKIHRSASFLRNKTNNNNREMVKSRQSRISTVVFTLCASNILSILPIAFINVFFPVADDETSEKLLLKQNIILILYIVQDFQNTSNFIIYSVVSVQIRSAYVNFFSYYWTKLLKYISMPFISK